jgi:type II secretory pathway pseudopilin PulG
MTLVEVVAGLALLAAVLGGILTAKSRCARQSRQAIQRQQAIQAADEMMSLWWQDVKGFPRQGSGAVPLHPGLDWRILPVRNPQAEAFGGEVVRLEIKGDASNRSPLIALEVVLPAEAKDENGVHPN